MQRQFGTMVDCQAGKPDLLLMRLGTNPLPLVLTDLGMLLHGSLEAQRPVVNDRTQAITWGARAWTAIRP
jgi:hypothetical protein